MYKTHLAKLTTRWLHCRPPSADGGLDARLCLIDMTAPSEARAGSKGKYEAHDPIGGCRRTLQRHRDGPGPACGDHNREIAESYGHLKFRRLI
ncbi:protein of unknown function [Methylorubrum extorquens]|uniref:Uncharacterized protein n=1 Tax=Methylorubrum extorquens TaxID=408 RepID=A0A2N9APH5_METEX|nr:protein of unknown function [Methylorubrum extorquens]